MNRNGETHLRPNLTNSAAYTGTAGTVSTGIADGVWVARVLCTTDAFIRFDGSAATSSDMPISGGVPEYFTVNPGTKVSAIQQSAGGTLYVTGMTN